MAIASKQYTEYDTSHIYLHNQISLRYPEHLNRITTYWDHMRLTHVLTIDFNNGHTLTVDMDEYNTSPFWAHCQMMYDLPDKENAEGN